MIQIVNVSAEFDAFGRQTYELRVNRDVVATFEHDRKDGLAECLRKAAGAVTLQGYATVIETLSDDEHRKWL